MQFRDTALTIIIAFNKYLRESTDFVILIPNSILRHVSPKPKLNGLASIPVLQLSNWKAIGSTFARNIRIFSESPRFTKKALTNLE